MRISDWSSDVCSSDLRAERSCSAHEAGYPMGAEPVRNEARSRGARMLRTAMGASIATWLADPQVIEIMLNPDGRLWVERLGMGLSDSGERLTDRKSTRLNSSH